jgi:putative acetyltransferase
MVIRKAKIKVARTISILRKKTFNKINKKDYPKEFVIFLNKDNNTKSIINKMKKRDMFCYIKNNKILGVVDLEGNKIGGLFIRHNYIKKGIGRELLIFIENHAKKKGISTVKLYSTKYAFPFYKKFGYRFIKKSYWTIKKDNITNEARTYLMKKILK